MYNKHDFYMRQALEEAIKAKGHGDVPIGAIIVRDSDGAIVGRGHNDKELCKDPLGHAEINAIRNACHSLSSMYLTGCTMYVTLEPCPMCTGACINARLSRVIYALKDPKAGAVGSVININSYPLNHIIQAECGILENESRILLRTFFEERRKKGQSKE